jgi:hypothetical protein
MIMWLLLVFNAFADEQHAIVVSQKDQQLELSKRELKKLFTGQNETWLNEQKLTIVLPLIESPEMLWLSRTVLGLPPAVYHRYLLEKAYRSGKEPPVFVATPTLVEGQEFLTVLSRDDFSPEYYSIIQIR